MIQPSEIERILKSKLPGAEVMVRDLTGGLDHFEVVIVSPEFAGLGLVEQHQKVYAALREQMVEAIHALTLKTYTPEDFSKSPYGQQAPKGIS